MAYALNNTNKGGVAGVVPTHQLIHQAAFVDPQSCLLFHPPPAIALFNPNFPPPVLPVFDLLVPLYHRLASPIFHFSPNHFLSPRMDDVKSRSLWKFIFDEGLVPSKDDEQKRIDVVKKLKQIISMWIKRVAHQRRLSIPEIAASSATIITYGSYGLGVHGPESDIDALCIAPYFATMKDDFFSVLYNMLKSRSEVSEIHCVKDAKVPIMRLKFDGISIDLPFAQLSVLSVPDKIDAFNPILQRSVDELSWKSLSAVEVNICILKHIPNIQNFRAVLRCIKLWAKRRGVYGNLFGFLGGVHLAVMTAYICQRHANGSLYSLIIMFFMTFSSWKWPMPVRLKETIHRVSAPCPFMPILLPSSIPTYCHSNISHATFRKIISELHLAFVITKDIMNSGWDTLFAQFPYSKTYTHFAKIYLSAPTPAGLGDWAGWVKSRFPLLILKLEEGKWMCDPNPIEYGEVAGEEPNVVFYWGLMMADVTNPRDISAVEADFRNDINSGAAVVAGTMKLSKVEAGEVPKEETTVGVGGVVRMRPGWRVYDRTEMMVPVYSRHSPLYMVGYAPAAPVTEKS